MKIDKTISYSTKLPSGETITANSEKELKNLYKQLTTTIDQKVVLEFPIIYTALDYHEFDIIAGILDFGLGNREVVNYRELDQKADSNPYAAVFWLGKVEPVELTEKLIKETFEKNNMGGSVFVGIKKDGTEYLMHRWTNNFVLWFLQPDFQNGGSGLEKYIDQYKEHYEEFLSKIEPIEYGIILIDFDTKKCISRQGYSFIDTFHFSPLASETEIKLMKNLLERNLIESIKEYNKDFSIDEFKVLFKKLCLINENLKEGEYNPDKCRLFNVLSFKIKTEFTIDSKLDNPIIPNIWQEILNFVAENNWKSKTLDSNSIKVLYDHMLADCMEPV